MSPSLLTQPSTPSVPDAVPTDQPQHSGIDQIAFILLLAYIVSQIYMVPLRTIGPSWSIWPSATDIVVPLIVLILPLLRATQPAENTILKGYLVVIAGCLTSYLLFTVGLIGIRSRETLNDKGLSVGLFQLYRLFQFGSVLILASRLHFTSRRIRLIRLGFAVTFWISSLLLLANYFDWIETPALAPHIPRDLVVSGPWAFYSMGIVGRPVGAISYHHAYPAIQLLLLAAGYLGFLQSSRLLLRGIVLVVLWICAFVSGSRAGFLAVSLFVLCLVLRKPKYLVGLALGLVVLALPVLYFSDDLEPFFFSAGERQASIAYSYVEDGLAGRTAIWSERFSLLVKSPVAMLLGTGFGSALESGQNAHMLYLHLLLELGLVGLGAFIFAMTKVLRLLWRHSEASRLLVFATVGLLVSAITQETFYPVSALGHFSGLYLLIVTISLSGPPQNVHTVEL